LAVKVRRSCTDRKNRG